MRRIALLAALALLMLPAAAAADDCEAPPGRSGIDQYCESLSDADGHRGADNKRSNRKAVPPETQRQLQDQGDDGEAVIGIASGGPPPPAAKEPAAAEPEAPARAEEKPDDGPPAAGEPSNNPLSAVSSAVDAGGTSGAGFVWLLVAIAVALCAIAWTRYRRRGHDQA